jgi:nitrogen fixation NifU-like protein
MSDKLDSFVKELQEKIYDDALKDYGRKAFDRWLDPKYMYVMENADARGRVTGSCGDTMEVFLRFEEGKVREASFVTDGCGPSMICGSLAAELAMGKSPAEIREISAETILDIVGGLPEEDMHCASLAANTLQVALHNYDK